jgi:translocation and assembly module TamB
MSEGRTRRKWKRWVLGLGLLIVAVPLTLMLIVSSGAADNYVRRTIIEQIQKLTSGSATLAEFHFNPWRLRVTLSDFTVHGREPAGTPPFFHADRLEVGLRIDSVWGRKFSLGDVEVSHPVLHLRLERDGSINVPVARRPSQGKPLRQRIFEIVVRRLKLDDGEMLFNDVRVPLVAEGGRFDLSIDYAELNAKPMYLGEFRWQQMELVARRYLPFNSDLSVRFTLEPNSFSVTQLFWKAPHTSIDAQLWNLNLANPNWAFRYRGHLDFKDLQTILRKPNSPSGNVDFSGDGHFGDGRLGVTGKYSAADIVMPYDWFHSSGITSRGSYRADRAALEVPDFSAQALGGAIEGQVQVDFRGLRFRVNAHAHDMDLATLLAAVNNDNLPVAPLHWGGVVDVRAVTTWTADFKNLDSRGVSLWVPQRPMPAGQIPVMATLDYHYSMAARNVVLNASHIDTPSSNVQFSGTLAADASKLDTTFDSQDLLPWDGFINRIRGKDAEPKIVAGRFHWQGHVTGPLARPTFSGHVAGTSARYDRLSWDEIEGDMTYSPQEFSFSRAKVRRERSSAQLDLSLMLDNWGFRPESTWQLDATLVRTDMGGLQALLGYSYPAQGLLSGTFHGRGTHADPELTGLFDIVDPQAWGWRFDRARGEITVRHGEVRVANAELRLLPPSANGANPPAPGILTGNFTYHSADGQAIFDLTGAGLPLDGVTRIQTPGLPIGGNISFHLNGQGPLFAPKLEGSLRLVDLKLSHEVIGSFDAKVQSDGSKLALRVDSAISTGELHGDVNVSLTGAYPLNGQVTVSQVDLDPLITSALHLSRLTGHSQIGGRFGISGTLLQPDMISVDANLSQVSLDYEYIKLQNQGPVQFQYGNHEVQVRQANLRGVDTDFRVSGFARFAADRAMDLRIAGAANLRLFSGFVPNLDVRGPAQVDAAIAGTLSSPQITGRVHVQDTSVRYGDFPAGLSQLSGDFIFDASRISFTDLTSETGGGRLQLSGSLTYGNGPLNYDLTARTEQVRVRYPVGMSWLAGGDLRLLGTAQAATLSGHVTVDRLLMSEGFDITSLVASSTETTSGPRATSPFLRNLQFDVQADTTPGAVLEWSSGRFQSEANIRVRGTWDHPVLLGNVHLLSGEMSMRGNQYRLTRGDINFANPFRADPVLNVEVGTTIQQYEVTVDFTGPASHLTMAYRSDPPLPSGDIITLLALGQPGEESMLRGGAAAVQTPQLGATTLLSEAISSQLGGRVQRLFGIRHFSVDPDYIAATSATQNPGARVTIAEQFSRNLVITYSTDVTSTQEQVIQIEYTVRPDVSVVALRDENGTFGIDVVRRQRFK